MKEQKKCLREHEQWKPVLETNGAYLISNYGHVVSTIFRNNIVEKPMIRAISPTDNGKGYKIVGLISDGKRKNFYVHRLVAEYFVQNPNDYKYVNHIDYNKENNHYSNLEWCTQKQNVRHSSHKMRHEKKTNKLTNTGIKYISKTKYNTFKVCLSHKGICKNFKTLDEAIKFKEMII